MQFILDLLALHPAVKLDSGFEFLLRNSFFDEESFRTFPYQF